MSHNACTSTFVRGVHAPWATLIFFPLKLSVPSLVETVSLFLAAVPLSVVCLIHWSVADPAQLQYYFSSKGFFFILLPFSGHMQRQDLHNSRTWAGFCSLSWRPILSLQRLCIQKRRGDLYISSAGLFLGRAWFLTCQQTLPRCWAAAWWWVQYGHQLDLLYVSALQTPVQMKAQWVHSNSSVHFQLLNCQMKPKGVTTQMKALSELYCFQQFSPPTPELSDETYVWPLKW